MKYEINLYGDIANVVWSDGEYRYIDLEYVDRELSALTVAAGDEVVFNILCRGKRWLLLFIFRR
ncbi:hypothetical protein [Chryseobacterium sp. SORGH_AS_0447]|uniref:hypothetical protein n=1 Tax=Chryseobacterium sp. SORGH_AS_0447 TaxID=3041769 RepID=UPI0027D8761D|nr:hypothetical protein [Chryseobacterium sp. SORGH_AS_0447]